MAITDEVKETLIKSITKILNDSQSIEEPLINMVLQRLSSLGYEVNEEDSWSIAFSIQKVKNYIKNSCNISSIPDGLIEITVDRVCGEFLFSKKQTGKLDDSFNLEVAVKQVQTGDTNVTFAINEGSETPEIRLNKLISYLTSMGEGDLVCYRQIQW